jgi:hypothetical protein
LAHKSLPSSLFQREESFSAPFEKGGSRGIYWLFKMLKCYQNFIFMVWEVTPFMEIELKIPSFLIQGQERLLCGFGLHFYRELQKQHFSRPLENEK